MIAVSIDGGPFVDHWLLPPRGDNQTERDLAALSEARIYAAGINFGGSEVKLTAHGSPVYVPDMSMMPSRRP